MPRMSYAIQPDARIFLDGRDTGLRLHQQPAGRVVVDGAGRVVIHAVAADLAGLEGQLWDVLAPAWLYGT